MIWDRFQISDFRFQVLIRNHTTNKDDGGGNIYRRKPEIRNLLSEIWNLGTNKDDGGGNIYRQKPEIRNLKSEIPCSLSPARSALFPAHCPLST
ncbi:MAG: hypothetical protein LBC77_01050, partial [Spirochaetaceae bacterium]|nr:hypothetical protein [Spirochaetaceae bacterium]